MDIVVDSVVVDFAVETNVVDIAFDASVVGGVIVGDSVVRVSDVGESVWDVGDSNTDV